jgi:excisionase family DNA binding protein
MASIYSQLRQSPLDVDTQEIARLEEMFQSGSGPAMLVSSNGDEFPIPESVYNILRDIVQALYNGQGVSVIPDDHAMTTQQAADCLNVSRPYFVKLLEHGDIPYHTVGKHRRVLAKDLMKYRAERDQERRKSLDEMTAFLQDEGFYDE